MTISVPQGGRAEALLPRPLPWDRIIRVEASCDCVSMERRGLSSAVVKLDLAREPDAKSFAPCLVLFGAAGQELGRVTVDVAVGPRPAPAGGSP